MYIHEIANKNKNPKQALQISNENIHLNIQIVYSTNTISLVSLVHVHEGKLVYLDLFFLAV